MQLLRRPLIASTFPRVTPSFLSCPREPSTLRCGARPASRAYGAQVFDSVVSVFAPCPAAEFRRAVRRGGSLVVASAGAAHLRQFRALLYDCPKPLPPRAETDPDMQARHGLLRICCRVTSTAGGQLVGRPRNRPKARNACRTYRYMSTCIRVLKRRE